MWHASVAPGRVALAPEALFAIAREQLDGRGDAARGEWMEIGERAVHLRRRLSADEQREVGPALDVRRTPEAAKRLAKVRHLLPPGWNE